MTTPRLPRGRSPTTPRSMEGGRLLIADDDPSTADIFAMLLAADPIELLIAADGRAALQLWRDHQPDLLLLDVALPHADGFEVCRQVRAVDSHIPILLITGADDYPSIQRGYDLGIDNYLLKPILDYRPIRLHLLALLRRVRRRLDDQTLIQRTLAQLAQHITHEVQRCGTPSQHLTQAQRILKRLERLTTAMHD